MRSTANFHGKKFKKTYSKAEWVWTVKNQLKVEPYIPSKEDLQNCSRKILEQFLESFSESGEIEPGCEVGTGGLYLACREGDMGEVELVLGFEGVGSEEYSVLLPNC